MNNTILIREGMALSAQTILSICETYSIWRGMRHRCAHAGNKDYGGRGISVCDRWRSFINFLEDMKVRPTKAHSIDRVDVNGNYEPSNCRWATIFEQANNKRPRAPQSPYEPVIQPPITYCTRGHLMAETAVLVRVGDRIKRACKVCRRICRWEKNERLWLKRRKIDDAELAIGASYECPECHEIVVAQKRLIDMAEDGKIEIRCDSGQHRIYSSEEDGSLLNRPPEEEMRRRLAKAAATRAHRPPKPERTHCPKGHLLIPENTQIVNRAEGVTEKRCATCNRERAQAIRDHRAEGKPAPRIGPPIKTVCKRGHPMEGDNLSIVAGQRRCKKCQAIRQNEYAARKAAK